MPYGDDSQRDLEIDHRLPALRSSGDRAMPTDACRFFYDCKGCGVRLKPKAGDCCVFCSYGSVPCPPIQAGIAALGFAAPSITVHARRRSGAVKAGSTGCVASAA